MKKLAVGVIAIVLIFFSCHKKSVPVITDRTTQPSRPVTSSGTILPDTIAGKQIFTSHCGRCHGLPEPAKYTGARWENILSYMMPRARLTNEQGIHVTAYLRAHAQN